MDSSTISDVSKDTKPNYNEQHPPTLAEPDNKFYEVEAIIDGPKRRREHLFKVCYKVRWKGYGPEADTWQPIRDLSNVQDMVEEFKKVKSENAKKKRKSVTDKEGESAKKALHSTPVQKGVVPVNTSDEDEKYDPEYGTVKDKFWKDLELGRHQNHAQLFCGDMYSKVKGCRRAAHAEAVANIQKQQQQPSKTEPKPDSASTPQPKSLPPAQQSSSVKLKLQKTQGKKNHLKASATLSSTATSSSSKKLTKAPARVSASSDSTNVSPPGPRARKRSSDPFSASGYTSSKRSRRSKESKAGKQRQSSMTSQTLSVEATTSSLSLVLPPAAVPTNSTSDTSVVSTSSTSSDSPLIAASTEEAKHAAKSVCPTKDKPIGITEQSEDIKPDNISQGTLKTTDQIEELGIDEDLISPEEIVKLCSDENFLSIASDLNESATNEIIESVLSAESEKPFDDKCPTNCQEFIGGKEDPEGFKCLGAETSVSVERSHDQECLWGGACNRSDCRSNRRRNMKNGQGNGGGGNCAGGGKEESSSSTAPSESVSSTSTTSASSSAVEKSSSSASPSTPLGHNKSRQHASPSPRSKNVPSPKLSQNTQSGSTSRPVASTPRAYSSDSSFDDSPLSGPPLSAQLSKQVVSQSFQHSRENPASSFTSSTKSATAGVVSSSIRHPAAQRINQSHRRGAGDSERPGLFSEGNSAFSFVRQDSGFAGDSPGSATVLPSPTSSVNPGSPEKENIVRNSASSTAGAAPVVSSSSATRERSSVQPSGAYSMEVDSQDVRPDSTVAAGTALPSASSLSHHGRTFAEPAPEVWGGGRKRFDLPLEKIPSPNSKKESDIDKRISVLTCDDLEDFAVQGEERYGQKGSSFVSNADLLQAVNLNKAEVVRKAIHQSSSSGQRLDFEQSDSTGLTLLMKAVQKGSMAITEMLLEHGANVNAQQENGTTALMIAAEQNNTGVLALLLKYGANSSLYTVNSDQAETAIMKAIKRQQKEVVSLMLRVGVNLAAPTCTSMSVLELAVERRNPQIEALVRSHYQRLDQAFRNRVLATLGNTVELLEPLFPLQCFPLRESEEFQVKFMSFMHPVASGEGFILFIAHTKINEKGVRCRFHGGCPISSVLLNGVAQSPLTKEVNFVTSCHPIVSGCNTLTIVKQSDYISKAKLLVQAFRAKLQPC